MPSFSLDDFYDFYQKRLCHYTLELGNARWYFSNIIAKNNDNACDLLATVNSPTYSPMSVAPELLSTRACNEFASLFIDKTQKIRQLVNASESGIVCVVSVST